MKTRIYSGITLTAREVRRILPRADFAGPVRRGDVARDLRQGYEAIGIIDGVFYQQLSVSPSELMDALRSGLKCFGASSMGALRAAELVDLGMIGVGEIFHRIRAEPAFSDDFLGQVFFDERPGETGSAYIEILMALEAEAGKEGLTAAECRRVCARLGREHFSRRSIPMLEAILRDDAGLRRRADVILRRVRRGADAKRRDALAMLAEMRRHGESVTRFTRAQREAGR